ncbi:MAG TPA: ABC transporter substrate-binding protein [Acidimicrobiales bacterium]|nr:ABC transporter substrate-binding protein [Acidimicrobiales bacterium]
MTRHNLRVAPLLLVLALLASACGARLTDAQRNAVRAGQTGTAVQGASVDGSGEGGDQSTDTTLAAGDTSSGGGGNNTTNTTSAGGGASQSNVNVHALPAGGNGGATDTGVTASSITLGNVSTLTGPVPGLFAGAVVGTQAVVAYENSLGGLWGRTFKLDARDDQFDTGQNRTQTIDLIGKAFAMLGSFSLYDDAAADQLTQAKIPDLSHALGDARFAVPTNFSIQPSAKGGDLGPFNYFKAHNPDVITKVGSIESDIPSAVKLHKGYRAAGESVGYKWLYDRAIGSTETDFTSDVVRMRDSGVKMVYLISVDDATAARFAKAMQSQNFKPEVFLVGGSGYDADVIAKAGSAAEGMLVTSSTAMYGGEDAASIPEVALFDKWVQKVKPGFTPDIFTAYAWAEGRLLFQAMENVGPKVTRAAINAEVKKIGNFDDSGLFAVSNPGAKGPAACWILLKVTGGKYVRTDSPKDGYRCDDGPWYFG